MGRIFYLMGKSSSGKDTIYQKLMNDPELSLSPYIIYTTRPIRDGEVDGVNYYFTDEAGFHEIEGSGKLIEVRTYPSVMGLWYYFTVDNDKVDLENKDYLMIGTPVSYHAIREYYGEDKVLPIYVEVEDGLRLQRALDRERTQDVPKYAEMCRRFLADAEDFSEEKILAEGITRRFENVDFDTCLGEIRAFILENAVTDANI